MQKVKATRHVECTLQGSNLSVTFPYSPFHPIAFHTQVTFLTSVLVMNDFWVIFIFGIMPKRVRLRAAGMMDDMSDWELWKEHSHIDILCKIAFIPSTFRLKAVLYACKYSQLVRSCWDGLFHFSHPLTVLVTPACDCCVLWYKLPFHGFLKAFFLFVLWTL